jgi:hypothetical protein
LNHGGLFAGKGDGQAIRNETAATNKAEIPAKSAARRFHSAEYFNAEIISLGVLRKPPHGCDACLIIHQYERFLQIMVNVMEAKLLGWAAAFTPVMYVDPFNAKMTDVNIYTSKHFRNAHERERRVVSAPTQEPSKAPNYLLCGTQTSYRTLRSN